MNSSFRNLSLNYNLNRDHRFYVKYHDLFSLRTIIQFELKLKTTKWIVYSHDSVYNWRKSFWKLVLNDWLNNGTVFGSYRDGSFQVFFFFYLVKFFFSFQDYAVSRLFQNRRSIVFFIFFLFFLTRPTKYRFVDDKSIEKKKNRRSFSISLGETSRFTGENSPTRQSKNIEGFSNRIRDTRYAESGWKAVQVYG